MREIKKQLSGNPDERRVFKLIPASAWLSAGQESIANKFAYFPAFPGKDRVSHEFRKWNFEYQATIGPGRRVANLDVVVSIAVSSAVVLKSNQMNPSGYGYQLSFPKVVRADGNCNPCAVVAPLLAIDRIWQYEELSEADGFPLRVIEK